MTPPEEAGGIDLIEIGTPLCKFEGVRNVVPIFRQRFPEALILADMKTMDGGGFEARAVYESMAGGGYDPATLAPALQRAITGLSSPSNPTIS